MSITCVSTPLLVAKVQLLVTEARSARDEVIVNGAGGPLLGPVYVAGERELVRPASKEVMSRGELGVVFPLEPRDTPEE